MLRYVVIEGVTALADPRFPWGTLVVNVSGSLVIGVIGAVASPGSRVDITPVLRHTLMGGVLGGFTTFSTFSLQTLVLVQTGEFAACSCSQRPWIGGALYRGLLRRLVGRPVVGALRRP